MPQYTLDVELVDAYERKARKTFKTVSDMADFDTALTSAAGLLTDLGNVTMMRILAYTLKQRIVYTDTADTGANRDEGATIVARKENNYNDNIRIPAPVESMREPDGTIDLLDAGLAAYLDNFVAEEDWTFSDGEQALEWVSGTLDK